MISKHRSRTRWLRHPLGSARIWLGGLVIDRVFSHQTQLRRIAAHNDRQENSNE